MTTIQKSSLLTLTLATTLISIADAQQVTTKNARRFNTYGSSEANVQLYAAGEIRREDMRYRATPSSTPSGPVRMRYDADGRIYIHTHVYGTKFTALVVKAEASLVEGRGNLSSSYYVSGTPRSSSVRGYLRLQLAGYVFLNETVYASGHIGGTSASRNVIDCSKTFYPSGIPVTVAVRGGATLNLSAGSNLVLNPTASSRMLSGSRVELTGNGTGYCYGAASAAVGWSGFGAGVEFELRFLNSTLSIGAAASATGLSGLVRFVVQPIHIFLRAFAECGVRYTVNIYDWSFGRRFTWSRSYS